MTAVALLACGDDDAPAPPARNDAGDSQLKDAAPAKPIDAGKDATAPDSSTARDDAGEIEFSMRMQGEEICREKRAIGKLRQPVRRRRDRPTRRDR